VRATSSRAPRPVNAAPRSTGARPARMVRATRVSSENHVCGWIVALAPVAAIAWHVAGMPHSVVLGVLVAALCHAVVLARLAHAGHVTLRAPVAVFAVVWGAAVAAPAAAGVNELLETRVRGLALTAAAVPFVEEATKAAVLVALAASWFEELRGVRAGIVIGGLVGVGFAAAENVEYFLLARVQEGPAGLVRAIAIRGLLQGAVHPVLTASTGAGLGVATTRRRALPGWLGFGAAVAQHAVWNGVASPAVSAILCNGTTASGACRGEPDVYRLFIAVPLVVVTALAPGVLGLMLVARRPASARG
jgi:RsiW-degrading membrane proteinase PrsW (M82 family)